MFLEKILFTFSKVISKSVLLFIYNIFFIFVNMEEIQTKKLNLKALHIRSVPKDEDTS